MKDFSLLISELENSGEQFFWLGKVDEEQVSLLEKKLQTKLAKTFKDFLHHYGGGGIEGSEISGIEDNDVSLMYGGTVYYHTKFCRENFQLPLHLIVIYYQDDEVCWCLDTSHIDHQGEYPVVSYDLFNFSIANEIAKNFENFFEEYLKLRITT